MKYSYSRMLNKTAYEVTYNTTNKYGDAVEIPGMIIIQWGNYDDRTVNITKNSFKYHHNGRVKTKFRELTMVEYQYIDVIDLVSTNLNQFLLDRKINAQENNQLNLIIMTDYMDGLLTDNK